MKKIIIILCLFMAGCSFQKESSSIDLTDYKAIVNELKNTVQYDQNKYFDTSLYFYNEDNRLSYILTIDNPTINMYDIQAVAYSDACIDSYHPFIGIDEDKQYNLVIGHVNKEEGYYKGIQLSGIVSSKSNIKLFVSFYKDQDLLKKVCTIIEVSK